MEEVPRRTSLVPLAFPSFVVCLIGVETEGLLDGGAIARSYSFGVDKFLLTEDIL